MDVVSGGGLDISVDTTAITRLAADLRRASSTTRRQLRKRVSEAARPVAQEVRGNYRSGGFEKAARAVRVSQRYGSRGASVSIRVDRSRAPYARGGSATFRHSVFGNPDVWVSQPTVREPFDRAVQGKRGQVEAAVAKVLDDIAKEITR